MGTAAVGMTVSAYASARLMMNLPAGILADRHGRKLLLVWGPALTALGVKPSVLLYGTCNHAVAVLQLAQCMPGV